MAPARAVSDIADRVDAMLEHADAMVGALG